MDTILEYLKYVIELGALMSARFILTFFLYEISLLQNSKKELDPLSLRRFTEQLAYLTTLGARKLTPQQINSVAHVLDKIARSPHVDAVNSAAPVFVKAVSSLLEAPRESFEHVSKAAGRLILFLLFYSFILYYFTLSLCFFFLVFHFEQPASVDGRSRDQALH
jgi:hypothetical protein